MRGQLPRPVGTMAKRFDLLASLGRAQIGPVPWRPAPMGSLEDQRLNGGVRGGRPPSKYSERFIRFIRQEPRDT